MLNQKMIKSVLLGLSGAGKTYGIYKFLNYLDNPSSTRFVNAYLILGENLDEKLKGSNLKISVYDTIGDMRDIREQMEMLMTISASKGDKTVINFVIDGERIDNSVNFVKYDLGLMLDKGILPYQLEQNKNNNEIIYKGKSFYVKGKPYGSSINSKDMIKTIKITKSLTSNSKVKFKEIINGNYTSINSVMKLANEISANAVLVGDSGEENNEAKYLLVRGPSGNLEKPIYLRNSLSDVLIGSIIYFKEKKGLNFDKLPLMTSLYSD